MTESRSIRPDDLLRFRFPSAPAIAPDGGLVAFVVRQADAKLNRYRSNVWLHEVDTGRSRPLTTGDRDGDPVWLRDGRLLFTSERGGDESGSPRTSWYTISADGGEAVPYFTIDRRVSWIRELDAGRFVVLSSWVRTDAASTDEHATRVRVFEEAPIWSNGSGYVEGRNRLGVYDRASGTLTDLTPETMACAEPDLDPAANRVVFTATDYDRLYTPLNRMLALDLGSGTIDDLSAGSGLPDGFYSFPVHLDAETLAFGFADPSEYGLNTSPQIYRTEISGGLAARLTSEPRARLGTNSVGSDSRLGTSGPLVRADRGRVYAVATEGFSSALLVIGADGSVERLTDAPGSVDAIDVRDGLVSMVAMRDGRLPELHLVDGRSDAPGERRVTALNDAWHEERDLAVPRHLRVSSHGAQLDAWVLLPADGQGGTASVSPRSLPAILDIHGGPRTVYGAVYSHEMQVWAAAGYAVIYANPHGSDGRGDEFADIRGRYGSVDYDDLMAVVDLAIEECPQIDPDRLCVTGGSYGGFMTNWIIGDTDRFVAAASQRSIANWVGFWGTSDIGYYFGNDQTGTTPWEDQEELWRQSPLAYADRVRTPTLFIHSDADYRCWIPDAIQMHTALTWHGVPSRLVWIEGENHELSRSGKPGPRLRRLREILEWFDRWTRPGGPHGGRADSDATVADGSDSGYLLPESNT